ncbi:MAG: hypothetical protein HY062_02340 [Bacteroidetes bacterium]|nr:hypothetical protein [Bacteroidota bacterium]
MTSLTILVLVLSLFFIPDNITTYSILAALPDKHESLKKIHKRKIILLGGSNVSFGINSSKLEEAFHKPVINLGVHAGLGLEFIVNDSKPYIHKGDTIILMPEYEHFYTENFYGEMELVSMIFDIEPASKQLINRIQWQHLFKYLPTYSAKKLKNYIPSLLHKKEPAVDIYHRYSFNPYGDAYIHWDMPNQSYQPAPKNTGREKINPEVITFLKDFKSYVHRQGAELFIFPPVIDRASFTNQKLIITKIAEELKKNDIAFVTEPETYEYDSTLFFNSYYHLNKTGVEKRTTQLINDLVRLKSE